jgi:hypothetical protein
MTPLCNSCLWTFEWSGCKRPTPSTNQLRALTLIFEEERLLMNLRVIFYKCGYMSGLTKLLNSVALGRKQTIPIKQPRWSTKLVPTFADKGCWVVSTMDPHSRNFDFLDRSHHCFFQVTPQLYSQGWVDPVPDPLLLRKSGSTGNWTRAPVSVVRNSDHTIKVNCLLLRRSFNVSQYSLVVLKQGPLSPKTDFSRSSLNINECNPISLLIHM